MADLVVLVLVGLVLFGAAWVGRQWDDLSPARRRGNLLLLAGVGGDVAVTLALGESPLAVRVGSFALILAGFYYLVVRDDGMLESDSDDGEE
jgi:hypothetical protein